MNILNIYQGGLFLGQKEYYLDNDSATAGIRDAYKNTSYACSSSSALTKISHKENGEHHENRDSTCQSVKVTC